MCIRDSCRTRWSSVMCSEKRPLSLSWLMMPQNSQRATSVKPNTRWAYRRFCPLVPMTLLCDQQVTIVGRLLIAHGHVYHCHQDWCCQHRLTTIGCLSKCVSVHCEFVALTAVYHRKCGQQCSPVNKLCWQHLTTKYAVSQKVYHPNTSNNFKSSCLIPVFFGKFIYYWENM